MYEELVKYDGKILDIDKYSYQEIKISKSKIFENINKTIMKVINESEIKNIDVDLNEKWEEDLDWHASNGGIEKKSAEKTENTMKLIIENIKRIIKKYNKKVYICRYKETNERYGLPGDTMLFIEDNNELVILEVYFID